LRSSLRIFSAKKSRIYSVRSEVNILVNPDVARKRQTAATRPDFCNNAVGERPAPVFSSIEETLSNVMLDSCSPRSISRIHRDFHFPMCSLG